MSASLPPICGDCEDHGDGSYTCDSDRPGCRYRVRPFDDVNPAPSPAAEPPDGLNDDWWTALYLATTDAVDRVPYAAASEYPVPHAAAFRAAAEAFLAPLLDRAAKAEAAVEPAYEWHIEVQRFNHYGDRVEQRTPMVVVAATRDEVTAKVRAAFGATYDDFRKFWSHGWTLREVRRAIGGAS